MKIVFLNPPSIDRKKILRAFDCGTESKGNYLYQPYDFLVLSARIPGEHEILFIDGVADEISREAYLNCVARTEADLFIQAFAECHWENDLGYLAALRERFPAATILVFGDSFLEESRRRQVRGVADGVITNPFLFELAEVLKGNASDGFGLFPQTTSKSVHMPPISIGLPRHELFFHRSYRWPFSTYFRYSSVFTTWGCPFSCSYCPNSQYPFLLRDEAEVLRELSHLQNMGIRELYFSDRSFGVDRKRTMLLLRQMTDAELRFSWSAYFHPNSYNPDLLELFKSSGCHTLVVGIETTEPESLRAFGRFASKGKLEQLIEHAEKLKINICGDFLIGLPGQSVADVEALIDYSKRLRLDYASFNILSPLPGSTIRRDAIAAGVLAEGAGGYDSQGGQGVLPSDRMSAREILGYKERAVREFYLRPAYLFRRLRRLRGFEHFLIQLQEMLHLFKKNLPRLSRNQGSV